MNEQLHDWTAKSVGDLGCEDFYAAQAIATAHNAALAAEREQSKLIRQLCESELELAKDEHDKQLAAEREKANDWAWAHAELADVKKQLAAERESYEKELDVVEENWASQLAAEKEKLEEAENITAATQVELDGADKVIANHKKWLTEAQQQLAAEREQIEMDTECIERIRNHGMKLEVELAAERERVRELERITSATGREAKLRDQLAAEREKREQAERELHQGRLDAESRIMIENQQLREQLAAAVELLKEAHERLGDTAFPSLSARIVAALAKTGGKK